MSDKEKRRQKRKEKEKSRERKKKALLAPGEIIPLQIDSKVNLYEFLKDMVRNGATTDMILQGIDLEDYLVHVDETLAHFRVPLDDRSKIGNILIRFGLLQSIQEEGKKMSIDANEPTLNYIADLWEHFNKGWSKSGTI